MPSEDTLELDLAEIKAHYKKVSQKRFKRFGERRYKVDRWLCQLGMFLIFAWLFFVAKSYDFDIDYYKCEHGAGMAQFNPDGTQKEYYSSDLCENPFYRPSSWKNQPYLSPGEYGAKIGPLFQSTYYAPFLIGGICLGLNHLIHNRKQRRKT